MDKYIKAVLAADGKVIIPRFGCIIEPSEEPGTLSFNPYLNFDDGKLAAAVSAGENIDNEAATSRVASAVDVYNNSLQDGNEVSISGIGSFRKGEDGRIEFTQSADFVHGDGDISLGMGIRIDAPAAAPAEPESETDGPEKEEPKDDAPQEAAAPAYEEPTYEEPANEEKKRKWPLVLLIIILLLIIIWLLLFVFFKDNAVYRLFCGKATPAQTEQVAPAPADSTAAKKDTIEATPAPAAKKQPARKAPTEARALDHRYNVIVGSYKEEATAIKRVKELQAKGYSAAFVGIKKEHFVAVIKDFASLSEAEAYQEKIVDGPDHIESWITNSGENYK